LFLTFALVFEFALPAIRILFLVSSYGENPEARKLFAFNYSGLVLDGPPRYLFK